MEELIWRYIDGECSEEERSDVEKRLESDEGFAMAFQEALMLDSTLTTNALNKSSHQFSVHMKELILSNVSPSKPIEILSLPWIIGLSCAAIIGVFLAIKSAQTPSTFLNFMPLLDEKVINMTAWVTSSFLVLLAIDVLIRKNKSHGKQIGSTLPVF